MKRSIAFILFAFVWSLPAVARDAGGLAAGVQLFESGRLAEAQQFFESFTRENPTDAPGAFYLGRTFFSTEQYEQAAQWFELAAVLDGKNSGYHLWLGRAYGHLAQRASVLWQFPLARKVRKHFERAVALDPDNVDARADLLEYYLKAPWIIGGSREKAEAQAHEIAERDLQEGLRVWRMIAEEGAKQYQQVTRGE
jgi:tetratricopeptide (TPR) repeat protein